MSSVLAGVLVPSSDWNDRRYPSCTRLLVQQTEAGDRIDAARIQLSGIVGGRFSNGANARDCEPIVRPE